MAVWLVSNASYLFQQFSLWFAPGVYRFLFSREGEQPGRLFYSLGYFSSVLLGSNGFNHWLN